MHPRSDDDVIASQNFPLDHDFGATASAQLELPVLQRYAIGAQRQETQLGVYADGSSSGQTAHKRDDPKNNHLESSNPPLFF